MIPRCRWTYWHIWSSQEQPAKPEFPGASKTTMICLSEERSLLLLLLSPFSRVLLCVTPKTAAHQAPLSLGFSRQEYWRGVPLPSPVTPLRVAKLSNYKQEAQFGWNFRLAAEGPQLPLNTASLPGKLGFLCSAPSLPNRGSLQLWPTGGPGWGRGVAHKRQPPFLREGPSVQALQECCSKGPGSSRAPGGDPSWKSAPSNIPPSPSEAGFSMSQESLS